MSKQKIREYLNQLLEELKDPELDYESRLRICALYNNYSLRLEKGEIYE